MREGIAVQEAACEGGDSLRIESFDKQVISNLSFQHDIRVLDSYSNTPIQATQVSIGVQDPQV
jgi:hypothetical protein